MSLDSDIHLLFPYSGGAIFSGQFIGKHDETPFVTPETVAIKQCK